LQLTIFVSDNNGGDISALSGLRIIGVPVQGFNVNDIKKC